MVQGGAVKFQSSQSVKIGGTGSRNGEDVKVNKFNLENKHEGI